MTRPVRHPKTGIFQFRKRVPAALQAIVGKSEEKISLGTRDPAEAKIAHARVSAEIEDRWQRLTQGAQSLNHRQLESVAGAIYRQMIEAHGDDPDQVPGGASRLVTDLAFLKPGSARISLAGSNREKSLALVERLRISRNAKVIDEWLDRRGLILEPESRSKLGTAVDRAVLQAREQLDRMSKGDYRPDPDGDRFPPLEVPAPDAKGKAGKKRSPLAVFDEYAKETDLKPRTVKRWRPILAAIEEEVPDLSGMTREWVIGWKDTLVARGLNSRTIREVYLASLKAVCAWAVSNNKITSNPAAEVSLKVRKPAKLRESGFTDEEAHRILTASLEPQPSGLSAHYRAARRWVPWVCAYTGARVGEIGQLRKEDVQERKGIPLILISPEAGTVKTNNARWVPLHPDLIRQGFLQWVSKRPSGPLFLDMKVRRGGSTPPAERVGQHLAKWVREIGVDDRRVQPNHAWRHRFKTSIHDYDLREDAGRYIQGHAPVATDEKYGDHKAPALLREIKKLPDIIAAIEKDRAE